jgi:hypothetical protein
MKNTEEIGEMMWKIWTKSRLNCEMIWKIWNIRQLNSEKI